ncbi:MAG TPA: hypothetical protein ENK89_04400 [Desulfobulbaceae bacterium]|nr:hypothetical protein [Desulfobulbaceae bacterium]
MPFQFKQKISQVIQGLSQDYRVYQGFSRVVIAVQLPQVLSSEGEGGNPAVIERNTGQIAAVAQKERSLEYVCGLEVGHFLIHLLAPDIDVWAEMR